MGDPLFANGVNLAIVILIVLLRPFMVGATVILLVSVLLMIWYERKVIAYMQNRKGPNRAGPFGLLQSLADGIKVFFKEAFRPARADKRLYRLAPYLSLIPAFIAFAVIPFGYTVTIAHHTTRLQLIDPLGHPARAHDVVGRRLRRHAGRLVVQVQVPAPRLPVRASAQMVSYEAALGLSVVTVVLLTGNLRTSGDRGRPARAAALPRPHRTPHAWNIIRAGDHPVLHIFPHRRNRAEMNRPPFDLVEAEEEIAGGYMAEYSAGRFRLLLPGRVRHGHHQLGHHRHPVPRWPRRPEDRRPQHRDHLVSHQDLRLPLHLRVVPGHPPRFGYDQLMDLGWKRLIPAFARVVADRRRVSGPRNRLVGRRAHRAAW